MLVGSMALCCCAESLCLFLQLKAACVEVSTSTEQRCQDRLQLAVILGLSLVGVVSV